MRTHSKSAARPSVETEVSRIFHIATRQDWEAAVADGDYRVSTLGKTLAEVGFIHCSTAIQAQNVADRYYRGLTDLLLLTIDTERLSARVRLDQVGKETYPHIYGPLNLDAVVEITALATGPFGAIEVPDLSM
jgi:glutathione S-transferase